MTKGIGEWGFAALVEAERDPAAARRRQEDAPERPIADQRGDVAHLAPPRMIAALLASARVAAGSSGVWLRWGSGQKKPIAGHSSSSGSYIRKPIQPRASGGASTPHSSHFIHQLVEAPSSTLRA